MEILPQINCVHGPDVEGEPEQFEFPFFIGINTCWNYSDKGWNEYWEEEIRRLKINPHYYIID